MSARAADVRAGSLESALRLLPVRAARLRDGTFAMGWAELRKLRHDHLDIFTRSVQPLLWLFVFGTALRHNQTLAGGSDDYRAYLAPGVMAQAALFVAIFFGLGVIWERDVGQLQRLLATPMPRLGIVLGKGHRRRGASADAGRGAPFRDRGCRDRDPVERPARARRDRAAPAQDGRVRVPLDDPRVARADARALHGDRPARRDAALLRLERALPARDHAGLAAGRGPCEPAQLRGARDA